MNGLILCRSNVSDKPYYITAGDVYIYSLEELCYYIYNNVCQIPSDFVSEQLLDFIEELGEPELAKQLKEQEGKDAGLKRQLLMILLSVDYYTRTEINTFGNIMDTLEKLSPARRLKLCGDEFLKKSWCISALRNYSLCIETAKKEAEDNEFLGEVYHNIGVAYGYLLLYNQAAEAFFNAYKLGKNPKSQKQYVIALQLAAGDGAADKKIDGLYDEKQKGIGDERHDEKHQGFGDEKHDEKYDENYDENHDEPCDEETEGIDDRGFEGIDEELLCDARHDIETAMDHAGISAGCVYVQNAVGRKKNGKFAAYVDQCDILIEKFKEECLYYMK